MFVVEYGFMENDFNELISLYRQTYEAPLLKW